MDPSIKDILVSLGKKDEFYEKASKAIEKAEEGAWDKSIFNDAEDFVNHYTDEILGDQESIFGLSKKEKEISTDDFFEVAVDSGFLNKEDLAGFQAIFDQNGDGVFSQDEIEDLLYTAYGAYQASKAEIEYGVPTPEPEVSVTNTNTVTATEQVTTTDHVTTTDSADMKTVIPEKTVTETPTIPIRPEADPGY